MPSMLISKTCRLPESLPHPPCRGSALTFGMLDNISVAVKMPAFNLLVIRILPRVISRVFAGDCKLLNGWTDLGQRNVNLLWLATEKISEFDSIDFELGVPNGRKRLPE